MDLLPQPTIHEVVIRDKPAGLQIRRRTGTRKFDPRAAPFPLDVPTWHEVG
jgi:hypothetical protein